MDYDVSLLLDGLILVFLCVTIFYAARLSLFMKSFREGRSDMQRLIRDLSTIIDKAESSVSVMKENAITTETDLREIINEAKFLSDELRFMNETGDGLADRLEKLADRNRELVDLMESSGGIGTQKIMPYEPRAPKAKEEPVPHVKELPRESVFEIDDFDFDEMDEDDEFDFRALNDGAYREEEVVMDEGELKERHHSTVDTEAKSKVRSFAIFDREYQEGEEQDAPETSVTPSGDRQFHSRAEQDLYEALQRKKQAFDKENPDSKNLSSKKVNKIS